MPRMRQAYIIPITASISEWDPEGVAGGLEEVVLGLHDAVRIGTGPQGSVRQV